ncbi:MAG: helix-turn-helix domain-containing protein [Parcubacteria group bacterium]|nr:helix-turn-helix domain-containing protein [Parcubacteria group bacterium]
MGMRIEDKNTESLFLAILSLQTLEESKAFFRDLLTEKEIEEFSNRWKAARMLSEGIPYSKIQTETGLSSRTVARISKWLQSGKDGYKLMINRTHHHDDS